MKTSTLWVVLERKAGRKSLVKFLISERISVTNFALFDVKDKDYEIIMKYRRDIKYISVENIICNALKVMEIRSMRNQGVPYFIALRNFG